MSPLTFAAEGRWSAARAAAVNVDCTCTPINTEHAEYCEGQAAGRGFDAALKVALSSTDPFVGLDKHILDDAAQRLARSARQQTMIEAARAGVVAREPWPIPDPAIEAIRKRRERISQAGDRDAVEQDAKER